MTSITSRTFASFLAVAALRAVAAPRAIATSRAVAARGAASRPLAPPSRPIPTGRRNWPRLSLDTCAKRAAENQLELVPLARREGAGGTGRQRAKLYRPETHANEPLDVEPHGIAEPADLTVLSFADRDLKLRHAVPEWPALDRNGLDEAILELDTRTRGRDRRAKISADGRDVGALDLARRMSEHVCRVAIGCEQQHAFREVVEAADIR